MLWDLEASRRKAAAKAFGQLSNRVVDDCMNMRSSRDTYSLADVANRAGHGSYDGEPKAHAVRKPHQARAGGTGAVNNRKAAVHHHGQEDDRNEDEAEGSAFDTDYAADDEEREKERLRERADMQANFAFPEKQRRSMRRTLGETMRRKRRLLTRSENLRFRELYRPPEPMVVVIFVALVTIVTLILTKSWPFY